MLPKGFYKLIQRESQPILVSANVQRYTPKQITKKLLCAECEQRLSLLGEDYVLKVCLRGNKAFSLLDILETSPPLEQSNRTITYDARQYAEINVDKLIYFGASVFWRGSVCSWTYDHNKHVRSYLGANYQEQFRTYLLCESPFPEKASIHLYLDSSRDFRIAMAPYGSRKTAGFHAHFFAVHGMQYVLLVGNHLPREALYGCLNRSRKIFATDMKQGPMMKGIIDLFRNSRPSLKLLEEDQDGHEGMP